MLTRLAWCCVLCGIAAGCGRLRYEERVCPQDTVEIAGDGGMAYCIDRDQREMWMTWVDGRDYCADLGRRFCTDAEWAQACNVAGPSLLRMTDDWEWSSDLVSPTEARKRGGGGCDAMSQHSIDTDAYVVRCCMDH